MLKSELNDMGMCWPSCCMRTSALCDACSLSLSNWLSSTAGCTIRRHNIFFYSQPLSKRLCFLFDTSIHSFYTATLSAYIGLWDSIHQCGSVSAPILSPAHTPPLCICRPSPMRVWFNYVAWNTGFSLNNLDLFLTPSSFEDVCTICTFSHRVLLSLKSFSSVCQFKMLDLHKII